MEVETRRNSIKRRLKSYTSLARERKQIEEQLARVEAAMTAPKAQVLDGMPKGSGGEDYMTRLVAKHIELGEKYQEKLSNLADAMLDIEHLIEGLEPTERRLARYRYIDGMTWEEVCVAMSYSWRQVHRLRGRMLDKLVEEETIPQF